MFFNGKILEGQVATIKSLFQVNVVSKYAKYLGLPSMIGRKRTSFFNDIKLRVLSKISSQAIPAYAISVFKLSKSSCDEIQKVIVRFWWGSKEDKNGIHQARWKRLNHVKSRGGLGFRDFSIFNHALVAKQNWRLLQNPESLVARVSQARYYKAFEFLKAKLGHKPSFIWRSIVWGKQVIQKEII